MNFDAAHSLTHSLPHSHKTAGVCRADLLHVCPWFVARFQSLLILLGWPHCSILGGASRSLSTNHVKVNFVLIIMPLISSFLPSRREAVQMHMGRMWLEFCPFRRADQAFPQTHGWQTLQVPPVWTGFLPLGPSLTTHEKALRGISCGWYFAFSLW